MDWSAMFSAPVVVLGCGNTLFGDGGIAPRAVAGLAVSASLVAAYIFYDYWFISVWCFFAAIISVTIILHFRREQLALDEAPTPAIGQ